MKALLGVFSIRTVRTSSEADFVDIFIPWLNLLLVSVGWEIKNGQLTFGIKSVGS